MTVAPLVFSPVVPCLGSQMGSSSVINQFHVPLYIAVNIFSQTNQIFGILITVPFLKVLNYAYDAYVMHRQLFRKLFTITLNIQFVSFSLVVKMFECMCIWAFVDIVVDCSEVMYLDVCVYELEPDICIITSYIDMSGPKTSFSKNDLIIIYTCIKYDNVWKVIGREVNWH